MKLFPWIARKPTKVDITVIALSHLYQYGQHRTHCAWQQDPWNDCTCGLTDARRQLLNLGSS